MKTQADLINRVLGLLGVIEVGQDPSAEDAALVQGHIQGKLDELNDRDILFVQDIEAIEDRFFLPIAKIIANAAGPEFSQAYDENVDAREEARIRDINRSPAGNPTMMTEFI